MKAYQVVAHKVDCCVSELRQQLEWLRRGTHDATPTRRLCNPKTEPFAFEIDCWWQGYFQDADRARFRAAQKAIETLERLSQLLKTQGPTAKASEPNEKE